MPGLIEKLVATLIGPELKDMAEFFVPFSISLTKLVSLAFASGWVAWVWTKEEVFREFSDYFSRMSKPENCPSKLMRKISHGLCCEVCVSHYPLLAGIIYFDLQLWKSPYGIGYFVSWMVGSLFTNVVLSRYSIMRIRRNILKTEEKRVKDATKSVDNNSGNLLDFANDFYTVSVAGDRAVAPH